MIHKPNPKKPYSFPLNITEEMRQLSDRRERRADELGIKLYMLDVDNNEMNELKKLEDYIVENFIDMDLDVPEKIKEKYLDLKKKYENMQDSMKTKN